MTQPLIPANQAGQQVILVVSPVVLAGETTVPLQLLYGSGAPANNVGNDKEFYLNIDNYRLYGPKIGGLWGDGYLLKGDKGEAGKNGDINLEGITTITGSNTSPTTINVDLSLPTEKPSSVFIVKLNAADNTLLLQNTTTAEGLARSFTLVVEQSGLGSSLISNWDPKIRWPDNVKPTLSYKTGTRDIFHMVSLDRGDSFIPFYLGGNYPV